MAYYASAQTRRLFSRCGALRSSVSLFKAVLQYFWYFLATMSLLTDEHIESLIEEIEKRPALYKKSLKEYSDINLKKNQWLEVCEAVVPNWSHLDSEEKTKQGRYSLIYSLVVQG